MTDEEIIEDDTTSEETIEDNPSEETPAYTGKYCNSNNVLAFFEDISDDPSIALLTETIDNTQAWIEENLKAEYVPVPGDEDTIPETLKTVAKYYASSDILMSLYHGEEYQTLMDYWFNKAQELLNKYINAYLNSEATKEEKDNISMVKHSHSPTYSQKRGRKLWVR